MAKAKKKLLPKEFSNLLKQADIEQLKAVFEVCELNAKGGIGKQTALSFDECPDELARWLVSEGADLSACDTWGNTPLHSRARRGPIEVLLELGADVNSDCAYAGTPLHSAATGHNPENARLLLAWGAQVDALNRNGLTPLELALSCCQNIYLARMASLAEVLLDAGAQQTPRMKDFVAKIGRDFEFHRSAFNPELVEAAGHGLDRLYVLFDVPPVPRRHLHDGVSPIHVGAGCWQLQHQQLWELLVPSGGPAETAQGEVVRISGRIGRELECNGAVNWHTDFELMADAFLKHVGQGNSLPSASLSEAAACVAKVKRKVDDTDRMAQLAVEWVLMNPIPVKLEPPAYDR